MSRVLKTLAKIGLVELDADDRATLEQEGNPGIDMAAIDRILQEEALSRNAAPVEASQSSMEATAQGDTEIVEGHSFGEIYALAQVPPSPYPVEKLVKVLDGLRAMDAATRKAAVMAIDAADEDWTIEDVILDAQRKIRALQEASAKLVDGVTRAEAKAEKDLETQKRYQQEATASIRQQIADLEALLQQELQRVAEEKAAIQGRLQATREACARETARFEQEIARLQEIPNSFAKVASGQSN